MDEDLNLPTDFVGTSRPSKRIQALYERKENAEKKALEELESSKQEACKKYEGFIEEDTKQLKKKLEDIRQLMKEQLFNIKADSSQDNAKNIEKPHFKSVYRNMQNYARQQHELVENFYLHLIKLEKDKAKEITIVLKKAYETIKRDTFKLPYECDEKIELEIEKVNQTILMNNHNYMQLKTKLQQEIQQHNKESIHELQQVMDCWVKCLRAQAVTSIDDLTNQYSPYFASAIETLQEEARKISHNLMQVDSVKQIPTPNEWLEGIRQTLARLDASAQKIILSYKQAAMFVYNKLFEEMASIGTNLEEMVNEADGKESTQYTPDLDEIEKMYNVKLETIQKVWNSLIGELKSITTNTYRFLKAATILWQRHFNRTETLQVVMLKDLENTIQVNNTVAVTYEVKLNVLIDTLRQAPSKDKLTKTLDDIKKLLAEMAELYRSQHLMEAELLKKYKNIQEFKVDILLSEIGRFLKVHPPDKRKDPKIQRRRASQTDEATDTTEDLIPNQMLFLKYQAGAIGNWQFGLWECIKNYKTIAKEELLKEADKWIQSHVASLDKRLEIRLGIHAMRLGRIQAYIHDERLEELCQHHMRFGEHRISVMRRLEVLQREHLNYQDMLQALMMIIESDVFVLSMETVTSANSYEAASRKPVQKLKFDKQIAKINEDGDEYLKKCNYFLNYVKGCHVVFLENMKLFCEEGNFCPGEIHDFVKDVRKLETQVEKTITNSKKIVETSKESALQIVNQHVEDLFHTIDSVIKEHTFIEDMNKKIIELQRELISEVCRFESRQKKVTQYYEKFRTEMMENCGDFEYFQNFQDQLNDIVHQLQEIGEFLHEEVPIKFYSDKPSSNHFGDTMTVRSITSKKGKIADYKSEEKSTPKAQVEDIEKKMFIRTDPAEKHDQETLSMRFNCILLKSWNEMKQFGDSFYTAKRRCFFLDSTKIPPSLRLLVKKFMYYRFHRLQNQCETKIMQLSKDFIQFVARFCTDVQEFIDTYPNKYCTHISKNFEQFFETEIQEELKEHKKHVVEKYGNLHNILKPLYGHPRNVKLLEKLEIEAEILRSETKELFTDIKMSCLEKMTEEYDKTINNYINIKGLLPECSEVVETLKFLTEDLSLKLNIKVVLAREMVNKEYSTRELKEIQPVIDHTKTFLKSFDSLKEPETEIKSTKHDGKSDTVTDDPLCSRSLTVESSFFERNSGYSDGYMVHSSKHSNSEKSNHSILPTGDMDSCLIDLKDCYTKCTQEVEGEKLDELLSTLAKEWRFAVNMVLKLYTLKYE